MDGSWFGSAVVIVIILAIVALVIAFVRYLINERKKDQQRRLDIVSLLRSEGVHVDDDMPFPDDLAELPVLKRGGKPKRTFHGSKGNAQVWIFDHTARKRPPEGRNVEVSSSSDESPTYKSRHTVALLKQRALSLPTFEILPKVAPNINELMSQVGVDESSMQGKLAKGLVSFVASMADPRTPMQIAGRDEFAEAYNVFADDKPAVESLLDDQFVDWLMENPGMIVNGREEWLLVSRNVKLLPDGVPGDIYHGWLPAEDTVELTELALELVKILGR